MASSSSAKASSVAVRRLRHDLDILQKAPNPQIAVQPAEDNLLEWHFVLHALPADTPYHGGHYHGKVLFPAEYPHAPPSILMVTPSGRLEVGQRLCLSMTDFHPESWNPAWSVETILVGLLSFFISDIENGYGAISTPEAKRLQLAAQSDAFNAQDTEFRALFPELTHYSQSSAAVEATSAVIAQDAVTAAESVSSVSPSFVDAAAVDLESGQEFSSLVADPGDSSTGETTEDTPGECWICRDTDLTEPLIQPCACRGSMSGVHASCVEQWIRHHRRNAVNNAVPCCSVCHQPYCGQETRPGVFGFFRHFAFYGIQLFIRSLILVALLVGYTSAADLKMKMPVVLRIILVALFTLAGLHKLLVLTVSLPPFRQPPNNEYIRRFFITDYKKLLIHVFEAYYTILILTIVAASSWPHAISWQFYLPFALASLVPIAKISWDVLQSNHVSPLACLRGCVRGLGFCLVWPFFMVGVLVPACHPLDAGLHIISGLAVLPMAWTLQSNEALVVLWGVHSLLVAAGLAERVLLKRLRWKNGRSWLIAAQAVFLGFYVANCLCEFPKGVGAPHDTGLATLAISFLWLGLVCALTLHVNWETVQHYYRTWQNQHGSFTLRRDAQGQGGDEGVEAAAAGGRVAPVPQEV